MASGKKGLGFLLLLGVGIGALAMTEQAKAGPKCEWEENLPEADKELLTKFMLASGTGQGLPDWDGSAEQLLAYRAQLQKNVDSLKARGYPKAAACLQKLGEDILSKPPTPPKVL